MNPNPPSDVALLYPFLSAGPSGTAQPDLDRVVAELCRSTTEKIAEVVELRRSAFHRDGARLAVCAAEMAQRFAAGARLLSFGNGGSSTDAQDLARLFVSSHVSGYPALPAIALTTDVALVTALSNDIGFDVVFARQVAAFGRPGDIAVGLSTSGSSANVGRGLDQAHRLGLLTVGLSGGDGGTMATQPGIDHLFVVASQSVHRIQEVQTTLYHCLWELTVQALTTSSNRPAADRRAGVTDAD